MGCDLYQLSLELVQNRVCATRYTCAVEQNLQRLLCKQTRRNKTIPTRSHALTPIHSSQNLKFAQVPRCNCVLMRRLESSQEQRRTARVRPRASVPHTSVRSSQLPPHSDSNASRSPHRVWQSVPSHRAAMPPRAASSRRTLQRGVAQSRLHRTKPKRWAKGGSDSSGGIGGSGSGPVHPAAGPDSEFESGAGAPTAAAVPSIGAAQQPAVSSDAPSRPAAPPVSSLYTDYWHLESGGVQWRSEVQRQARLLAELEAHLLQPPTAEAKAKQAKLKQQKQNRKAKRVAAAAAAAAAPAAPAGQIDLTADDADAPAAAAARKPKKSRAVVSSSDSDSGEEVDVHSLVSFAHRSALSARHSPPLALTAPESARRKKKRIQWDEEDEEEEKEAEPGGHKRKRDDSDDHAAAAAAASASEAVAASSPSLLRDRSDGSLDAHEAELSEMGGSLRGILTGFHSAARKAAAKLRKKARKEEALFAGIGLKNSKAKQHGQKRGRAARDRTPSPDQLPRRRRAQKTHRITMWKDETLKANSAAAAAAAASAAASSSSAAAAAPPADPTGLGLPIEQRLSQFSSQFLCVGSLALRADGALDESRVSRIPLRIAFSQKLLPAITEKAVQMVDTAEPLHCYFRSAEDDPATKARLAAIAAEKRAQARLRKQQESDEEDAFFARRYKRLADDDAAAAAAAAPLVDTEEKTQSTDHLQDPQAVSAPIIWHPAAVLYTHHARAPVRIIPEPAVGASASAVSSAPLAPVAPIDSATLDALFALFSRQLLYLHPIYSARDHCFLIYVYLMPAAWHRASTSLFDNAAAAVHSMQSEAVCAQIKLVVAQWGCQLKPPTASVRNNRGSGHFNPHALYDACRPPSVNKETVYPAAESLALLLRQRGLLPTLHPYQQQAICWMLQRERTPWKALASKLFQLRDIQPTDLGLPAPPSDGPAAMEFDGAGEEDAEQTSEGLRVTKAQAKARLKPECNASWLVCHPPRISHPFAGSSATAPATIWLNEFTGAVSARPPSELEVLEEVRGGILSDEMGLGKTLCCVSLLLAHPRQASSYGRSGQTNVGDLGGAMIPILPNVRLPSELPTVAPASISEAAAAAASALVPSKSRPAPPLLVDPLELSKRALNFYQNQIAHDREREQQQTKAKAPSLDAAGRRKSRAEDSDEGEAEFGEGPAKDEDAAEKEKRVPISCYCGHDAQYFKDSGEQLVECELCHSVQHALCMRAGPAASHARAVFAPDPAFPYAYLCPTCSSLPTTPKLPIGATLVVCPDTILKQWEEELARHVSEAGAALKVLVYRGVRSTETDATGASTSAATTNGDVASIAASPGSLSLAPSPSPTFASSPIAASPSPLSSAPIYSVFVATADFVSIRVQRPIVLDGFADEDAMEAAGGAKKKRRKRNPEVESSSRTKRGAAASKPASDDPPALAVPTVLPFSLVRPSQFASYDIVLTTYSVLQQDLYHTDSTSHSRSARYAKKYRVLPTPLLGVNFWRIVCDEAQLFGEGSVRSASMALMLSTVHRWNVTGTPIFKSFEGDLYGLILFLGLLPYSNRAFWRRVMAAPYEASHPLARSRMHALISRIMWRNTKASVVNQLDLPPTTTTVVRVKLTPIERYLYDKRRDECREASTALRQYGKRSLSNVQLRKAMQSMLRLRQACVHPQIGSTHGLASITKHTLTLSELSLEMLRDARLTCEEVQRRCYFAMHGLAALCILKREWDAAIELYERVVDVDERLLTAEWEQQRAAHFATKEAKSGSKYEEEKQGSGMKLEDEPASAAAGSSADPAGSPSSSPAVSSSASIRREIEIDVLQKMHALHNLADALAMQHGCKLEDIEPADFDMDDSNSAEVGSTNEKPEGTSDSTPMEDVASKNENDGSHGAGAAAPSLADEAVAAAPASSAAAALAALPAAVLRRIRLLKRFVSQLRHSYLHKQSVLVAEAQAKFNSANQAIYESMQTAVGEGSGARRGAAAATAAQRTWWLDCLSLLRSHPELEEKFISLLRRDLFLSTESLVATEKAQPSIAERFRDGAGLRFLLVQLIDELDRARTAVTKKVAIQALHQPPSESEIRGSSHCGRCRLHQSGPACVNCKTSHLLHAYEQKLFRFRFEQKSQFIRGAAGGNNKSLILDAQARSRKEMRDLAAEVAASAIAAGSEASGDLFSAQQEDDDAEAQRVANNFQQDSELFQSLKLLAKFVADHSKELEPFARDHGVIARSLQQASDHLSEFELMKKELKTMLALNRVHREQLSLIDELEMTSVRIRLRYDGEEVPVAERHAKLHPHEVDHQAIQFQSDIATELSNLRDWKAKMRFLQAQVQAESKQDAVGQTDEERECSICRVSDLSLEKEVAVLPCAHRFCCPCMLQLLSKREAPLQPWLPEPSTRVQSIRCPQCRQPCGRRQVMYVSVKPAEKKNAPPQRVGGIGAKVETESGAAAAAASSSDASSSAPGPAAAAAPLFPIRGSWSSKIQALLQCILSIRAEDPSAKCLLFSEWSEALVVVGQALRANSVNFLQIGGGSGSRSGGGPKKKMHATLKLFKANPMIPLLLLPLATASSGLNIVEANHVLLVEPSLSFGRELQAIGRIVRMGQVRPTFVHRFIVESSVEEKIFAMNAHLREGAHKAEQLDGESGHDDDEEEYAGDVLLGARNRAEDVLDADNFAQLIGEESGSGSSSVHAQPQPVSQSPDEEHKQTEGATMDEQDAQDEADLQRALQASLRDSGGVANANASGLSQPMDESKDNSASSTAASSSSSALARSESALLSRIAAEEESLTSQHAFWTGTRVMLEGRPCRDCRRS